MNIFSGNISGGNITVNVYEHLTYQFMWIGRSKNVDQLFSESVFFAAAMTLSDQNIVAQ